MNPSKTVSNSDLAQKFIDYATNGSGKFDGKPGFSDRVMESIRAAAELKAGRTLFQQLLDSRRVFTIVEGKNDDLIGGNKLNPLLSSIALNFDNKLYYASFDESGERSLVETPVVCILLHELTHFKHWTMDTQAMEKRLVAASSNQEMHNQEEELTITGAVAGSEEKDPCNDNEVLAELKLPHKIDHDIFLLRSPVEAFQEMILGRTIGTLRTTLASSDGQKIATSSADLLLQLAVKEMLESKTPTLSTEYVIITELLIKAGCRSDKVLADLLRIPHPECLKIAQLLVKAECKSDSALESAVGVVGQVNDLNMRKTYLDILKLLMASGCKSNEALGHATLIARQEADPLRQDEWFVVIDSLMKLGCHASGVLRNVVDIIKNTNNTIVKKKWVTLIEPLIDQALDDFASKILEEFGESMEKLMSSGYTAISMKLFETQYEFLAIKDRELLQKRSKKLHEPIELIHGLIKEKKKPKEINEIVKVVCFFMPPAKKFIFLHSLIEATLYIAVSGGSFIENLAVEFTLPQFVKMKGTCESIKKSHNERKQRDENLGNRELLIDLCLIKESQIN